MARQKRVYLDFASATPMSTKVARAYARALTLFGNASAVHAEGRLARVALEAARVQIARSLAVKADELVFTSGGTESNSIAIMGVVRALRRAGKEYRSLHIISTTIEHASVLGVLETLEADGVHITRLSPQSDGRIDPATVRAALTKKTVLVTLAHVNSESGTVQPIKDISRQISIYRNTHNKSNYPYLHVDAAQSPLWLDAGPHTLGADLVSYDAQKVMGPKGVGVLYRDFAVPIAPLFGGGTQERSLRPGTENVPALVAAGVAFTEAVQDRKQRAAKIEKLRDYLAVEIKKQILNAVVIGTMKHRVANNLFLAIPGVDGDYLAVCMDNEGVAVSPRSACAGSGGGYSHVAQALTGDTSLARGTIRFALGTATKKTDLRLAVQALVRVLRIAHD